MDKGRRQEIKMLKYIKRLKNLGLMNAVGSFFAFRSHGKPCSCWACKNQKYKRASEKSNLILITTEELASSRGAAYHYLLP